MQASRADRLGQRIALHAQLLGNLRGVQTLIEQRLPLLQHLGGQHRRPPPLGLGIKPGYAPVSIALNGTLDADQRDTKGTGNIGLLGIAVDTKLRRNHAKGRNILFSVDKHRHVSVEVGHLSIPFLKC